MAAQDMKRILIVDDEPRLREMLAEALSESGAIIQTAGSGREAIALANSDKPDIVITDLCLGDCSGVDVVDHLRNSMGEVPTVFITGKGDEASLSEATSRKPLELMTKPLNIQHLRDTVSREIARLDEQQLQHDTQPDAPADTSQATLTQVYQSLSEQVQANKTLIDYQAELLAAKNDDDVFRVLFRSFARKTGPLSGMAMVCDSNAELRIVGRFGVPHPDNLTFCRSLAEPLVDVLLGTPQIKLIDAMDEREMFDEAVQRFLPGVTLLALPLIPTPGEMIGVVVLYRKGEQPFLPEDLALAQLITHPTALAVRRND